MLVDSVKDVGPGLAFKCKFWLSRFKGSLKEKSVVGFYD